MGGNVYGPDNSKQVAPSIRLMRSVQPNPLDGAEIQHRRASLFLTTRGMDMVRQMFGGDLRVHRPERVNQKIDCFNATLKEIRDNKEALDNLLPWQKEHFEKTLRALFIQFDNFADQAVEDYGRGIPYINKNENRRRGEETIDLINQELERISENLRKGKSIWEAINMILDKIKKNRDLLLIEDQIIDKQIVKVKYAYGAILIFAGRDQNQKSPSTEMQIFEQAADLFKRMLYKLEEEISKDLTEMVKEAQEGTDDFNRITKTLKSIRTCRLHLSEFESHRLNQLLRKQADAAERAYNEVLAYSQKRQNRAQLKVGIKQLKEIADSLEQTLVRLEKGWIDSIGRRAKASDNWFNGNSYIPEEADKLALVAIKEKYKSINASVKNLGEGILDQKEKLNIDKIEIYDKSVTALENQERALVKLAFPLKFQEICRIIEQMASLEDLKHLEIPFKGMGPSNQITEVLRETYARCYDTTRASILAALRADISYAALVRAQHAMNRLAAAQKGLQEIIQIAEQMQEILDAISQLESQTIPIGLNNQIIGNLRENYITLYNDARASIIKAVQAGVSDEALAEAQAVLMRLQGQVRLPDRARKNSRSIKRYPKKR